MNLVLAAVLSAYCVELALQALKLLIMPRVDRIKQNTAFFAQLNKMDDLEKEILFRSLAINLTLFSMSTLFAIGAMFAGYWAIIMLEPQITKLLYSTFGIGYCLSIAVVYTLVRRVLGIV